MNRLPPVWPLSAGFIGCVAAFGTPGAAVWRIFAVLLAAALLWSILHRRLPQRRDGAFFLAGVLLGAAAWGVWLWRTPYYQHGEEFAPVRFNRAAVRIVEAQCAPDLEWLGTPRRIEAEVLPGMAAPPGRIYLFGLDEYDLNPAYGDCFLVTGTLRGGEYPALYVEDAEYAFARPGVNGRLLRVRDAVLGRLAEGLDSDRSRAMLAAMLFGCRQGLDRDEMADYARTGVIHIFSVSGLHIGLLGGLVLLALFRVPFRWRYYLALGIILYVAMTGWQVPSVRAYLMFAVWCLARARLAHTPSLRLVALAAVVVLCWQPMQLWTLGFQFSFLVTALLIAAMECQKRWQRSMDVDQLWRPAAVNRRFGIRFPSRLRRKLFGALFCAVIAYLGGVALVLFYQGVFAPVSVLANLFLIPLVSCAYPLAALKLVVTGLPGLEFLAASGLDGICALMDRIVRLAAVFIGDHALAAPRPWQIALFYCGLFWLLLAVRHRLLGWLPTAGMWCWWALLPWLTPPALLILRPAYQDRPAVVIAEPAAGRARLVGNLDYDGAWAVADWLARRGVRRVETLYLSGNLSADWRSVLLLGDILPVDEVVLAVPEGRRNAARLTIAETASYGAFRPGYQRANGDYRLEWREKDDYIYFLGLNPGELALHFKNGKCTVTVDGAVVAELPPVISSRPEMLEVEWRKTENP